MHRLDIVIAEHAVERLRIERAHLDADAARVVAPKVGGASLSIDDPFFHPANDNLLVVDGIPRTKRGAHLAALAEALDPVVASSVGDEREVGRDRGEPEAAAELAVYQRAVFAEFAEPRRLSVRQHCDVFAVKGVGARWVSALTYPLGEFDCDPAALVVDTDELFLGLRARELQNLS
jgi:hypothetical protein